MHNFVESYVGGTYLGLDHHPLLREVLPPLEVLFISSLLVERASVASKIAFLTFRTRTRFKLDNCSLITLAKRIRLLSVPTQTVHGPKQLIPRSKDVISLIVGE